VAASGDKEVPNIVLEQMIQVTRACGGLGIPGSLSFHTHSQHCCLTLAQVSTCPPTPARPTQPAARACSPSHSASFSRRSVSLPSLPSGSAAYTNTPTQPNLPHPPPSLTNTTPYQKGPQTRHRPMQRQAVQPLPPRPDHLRQGLSRLRGEPRGGYRRGRGRVREVR
jgi:hypothetical protein